MLVSKCKDYIALTDRVTASDKSERMEKKPWHNSRDYSHVWVEGLRQNRKTLVRLHGDTSAVKVCTSCIQMSANRSIATFGVIQETRIHLPLYYKHINS